MEIGVSLETCARKRLDVVRMGIIVVRRRIVEGKIGGVVVGMGIIVVRRRIVEGKIGRVRRCPYMYRYMSWTVNKRCPYTRSGDVRTPKSFFVLSFQIFKGPGFES
jgi:hypothetical protein